MLNQLQEFLLAVLYPPKCPGCRHSVEKHGDWCPQCLGAVWHPRVINGSHDKGLDGCYCLADYRGGIRHVLRDIKFNRALRYDAACRYLLERFPWPERIAGVDMVVPVPLSKKRLQKRGYNQTEIIFRAWAEAAWPWTDALERVRYTQPQWGLDREERMDNIKRAFAVNGSFFVRGKHILLVDDIYTTGATMKECAGALKQKGAAAVTGLVIASGAS